MSDTPESQVPAEKDPEKLLEATKAFVANVGIEDFIDLCRSCMTDDATNEVVLDYLEVMVTEMAKTLVRQNQHLAAVQLVVRCGMPRNIVMHYVVEGLKVHKNKKDVVRALIRLEFQIYNHANSL
jgi:hypothetical protein